MRVKVGSVAFLEAAGSEYGIGLDEDGHRVEFIGSWNAQAPLQARLDAGERVEVNIKARQVVAVDGRAAGQAPPRRRPMMTSA